MKKLFTLMLSILCVTAIMAQEVLTPEADGYYHVGTAADLKAVIQADNSAKVKITCDMDISDLGKICDTFRGTIDGGYETVDSLGRNVIAPRILTGKRGQDKGSDHYLFEKVVGANILNVAFYKVRVDDEDNSNLGVIAREGEGTTFEGVMMLAVSVYCNHDNAGSLVGYAKSCTFNNVKALDVCVTTDGVAAGSIVGKSENSNFYFCMNNMTTNVFSDGRWTSNWCLAGGICGYSISDNFYDCANLAWVGGNEDEVGGIVGRGMGSNFVRCVNRGYIIQMDEENFQNLVAKTMKEGTTNYTNMTWLTWTNAGIIAVAAIVLTIVFPEFWYYFVAYGLLIAGVDALLDNYIQNATITGHDELGGIAGHAENGSVEQCCNYGFYAAIHKYCGGIIGWAKNMIVNNCYVEHEPGDLGEYEDMWETKYLSYDNAGSIMGYASKCKITNCATPTYIASIGDISDLQEGSGYVFRFESDRYHAKSYEMNVYEGLLRSGIVGYWMNNSPENLAAGIKPWRQNLKGDHKDLCPRPDPARDELSMDSLKNLYFNDVEPNVFKMSVAEYMKNLAINVNEYGNVFARIVLEDDLDMSNVEGMLPIGTPDHPFCGIFDGQGHTIKGLKINNDYAAGLFGYVGPLAIIENVILEDGEIVSNGDQGAGGIVGAYKGNRTWGSVLIRNCGSSANVTAPKHAAGIFGRFIPTKIDDNYDDAIKINIINCYNTGTVTATTDGNSGLIGGYMRDSGVLKNCWSAGKLLSGTSAKPYDATHNEFFVGYMDKADIKNCYAIDPATAVNGATEDIKQNNVTNLSATDVASGLLALKLNQGNSDCVWQQVLGVDAMPSFGDEGVYHVRTVSESSKGYGTVCLPFALESNDDISYYIFNEQTNSDNGDIVLSFIYVPTVEAGKPALFRTSKIGDFAFYGVGEECADAPYIDANPDRPWGIAGTYTQQVFDETTSPRSNYVYYVSGGEIRNAKKVTIAPFRAYLLGQSVNSLIGTNGNAKTVTFVLEDEDGTVASLQLVGDDLVPVQNNGKAYTIMGTEANKNYHGIVIKNGKKVVQ